MPPPLQPPRLPQPLLRPLLPQARPVLRAQPLPQPVVALPRLPLVPIRSEIPDVGNFSVLERQSLQIESIGALVF